MIMACKCICVHVYVATPGCACDHIMCARVSTTMCTPDHVICKPHGANYRVGRMHVCVKIHSVVSINFVKEIVYATCE